MRHEPGEPSSYASRGGSPGLRAPGAARRCRRAGRRCRGRRHRHRSGRRVLGHARRLITSVTTVAPDAAAAAVIAAARTHLGDKYVYGDAGPTTWDCSGFTSVAVEHGRRASRRSRAPRGCSRRGRRPYPPSQVLPGDLYFLGTPATHVGIVVGAGMVLDASASPARSSMRQLWATPDITSAGCPRPGAVPVTGAPPTTAAAPPTTAPATRRTRADHGAARHPVSDRHPDAATTSVAAWQRVRRRSGSAAPAGFVVRRQAAGRRALPARRRRPLATTTAR